MYIHELRDWPCFSWDETALSQRVGAVRHRQGRLVGRMEALGFDLRTEATLATLTDNILKSSEIEGELLDRTQVRSSLAQRLGVDVGAVASRDRHVEGVVEMTLDATEAFSRPLTKARLFAWHAALFPTGRSGMTKIIVGAWRDACTDPMRVVSGPLGRERIHYEAPKAARIDPEISDFLRWFEQDAAIDPVVKAALAHLWFVTIHPFDDGNGRIARAIADMALARSEQVSQRFYSMSAQIRLERKAYYDALEAAQKGSLDVTAWLLWFLDCLERAIDGAEQTLAGVLKKARFWETFKAHPLNERQLKVINKLLDGFEGKMTSSKWARLTKCSQDTALRDINDLIDKGILVREPGGGRSTSYTLAPAP